MRGKQQRLARLVTLVGLAALILSGAIVLYVQAAALADAGIDGAAAARVRSAVLVALLALGVILLGLAGVAGRALARALTSLRATVLAHARGDSGVATPDFVIAELTELVSAVERLAARVARREAHIEREDAEVSVLLDAISEGILQLDGAGRVLRANPAARSLLGLTERAIGQPIATQIRQADLRRLLDTATSGTGVAAAEVAVDERRLLVAARPLIAAGAGERGGTVVAFVDLTEMRRLESVRRDFVANVSHELKTPLTSIRGYVETLLADAELPEDVRRQFLEVVHKNADRLHRIVDDLLDLSRLESGGWRPDLHEVNALDVIEDVWSTCSERAAQRGITFVPPATPLAVYADSGGLRQILANLLDNALRYTPDGGRIEVVARTGAGPVNGNGRGRARPVAAAQAGAYVTFEVRDSGTGIPSDALTRIFERFYRVDPARSRAEGGTGLGLSIVKHLVESMGGDVAAESELGKGTTIRFRLPAAG